MFKLLITKLTTVLGLSRKELNQYLICTRYDKDKPLTVDNLKCIILKSFITNTCSNIQDQIQPLLPTGFQISKADFYPDDTAMLLKDFKINAEDINSAPTGLLINRQGAQDTSDVLANL